MVREAKRDEKGIGHRPGTQNRGQNYVANKAGDPRKQRKTADGQNAINHREQACCGRKTAG
jgi:hypothetical protein